MTAAAAAVTPTAIAPPVAVAALDQPTAAAAAAGTARLTLPLGGAPLLAPFKLAHDAQFTSKVFHIKPQLFETLSKSMGLANPQTATVIQELQFRAYLTSNHNSTPNKHNHNHTDSLLASSNQQQTNQPSKECNWPELFQLSVNQSVVHLDRGQSTPTTTAPTTTQTAKLVQQQQHKPADIFHLCLLGDNVIEIQVNNCYCSHEFVLEAVERPTLKAFMNSCFKSRMLSVEACLQKMKFNFGSQGFLIQQTTSSSIFNEYISEFNQQTGLEQTKTKISLKCPITNRRMRTPTRGHNCKHIQVSVVRMTES